MQAGCCSSQPTARSLCVFVSLHVYCVCCVVSVCGLFAVHWVASNWAVWQQVDSFTKNKILHML